MRIRIITITHKTPAWVKDGFNEYAKRVTGTFQLELHEIPAYKRSGLSNVLKAMEEEGKRIIRALNPNHYWVALTITGKTFTTDALALQFKIWLHSGKNIDLIIGGPDGLSKELLQKTHEQWSLSPLTFPHFLVRVIIAEQIYRISSILKGHPYHR